MKEFIGRVLVVCLYVVIGTAYATFAIEIGCEAMRWTKEFFRRIKT